MFNLIVKITVTLSVFLLISCSEKEQKQEKNQIPKYLVLSDKIIKDNNIKTIKVQSGEIKKIVDIQGIIIPNANKTANIVPLVAGIIVKTFKEIGDSVKKNDKLLILDSKEMGKARIDYINVFHKSNFAWKKFKMEREIYKQKIGSKLSYLISKEGFHSANVAKKIVYQRLKILGLSDKEIKRIPHLPKSKFSKYVVKSSVDGMVLKKYAVKGEYITDSNVAYSIVDLSDLWVDFGLSEKCILKVKPHQKILITSCTRKIQKYGEIIYIAPVVDEKTRKITVRVKLDNKNNIWYPGSCATGLFILDKKQVKLRVPKSAIINLEGNPYVFAEIKKNTFKAIPVVTGSYDNKYIEIKGGLKPDDKVVYTNLVLLKGQWYLNMGD